MLGELYGFMDDAFSMVQTLILDGVHIEHLPELYNKVEDALELSIEILNNYSNDGEL